MFRVNSLRTAGLGSIIYSGLITGKARSENHAKSISAISMSGTTETILKSNPLLSKSKLPLFTEINALDVTPAIELNLNELSKNFESFENAIEKSSGSSYTQVIEDLEKLQFPLARSWGVVSHLMSVQNSDELRKAHDELQPKIVKTFQKLGQSKSVYKSLMNIKSDSAIWNSLDEGQQRIVDASIHSMRSSGVGLEGDDKTRFNELQLQVAELSTKFSNNILDSTKAFKLVLTDKELIRGLPESAIAFAAQQAASNGHPEATKENGPWLLTLDMPSYLPAMQNLESRSVREQLYRAFISRASVGEHDNVPIIAKVLQNKKQIAQLLGYQTHAEKSLSKKMASSVDEVMQLIEMLRVKAFPAAQKELAELQAFAASRGHEGPMLLWDITYWSERFREHSYNYKEEALREYFAMPNVLDGLFTLATRLFNIVIEEPTAEERAVSGVQLWHPDVRFYNIKDAVSGEYLASFYLDPYSRPAEKRGGAWMDSCLGRSRALSTKPVAYLVCNGSPPVGEKPSLMTFREVETLFHEFGHGLQHMLTRVEYGDAAGISNVEWDAVELPSQFMENWCYDKPTLYTFAKHYSTGEPLPIDLFEKVKQAKNYQSGLGMVRQLLFSAVDMKLHSDYNPDDSKVSPFDVYQSIASNYAVVPPLKDDRFLCSFSHIFAGGYSAGYFSYKWAEVMSADAFAAFEEAGLDNEVAVKEMGKKFRDTVLSKGGARHPSLVYRDFRGRGPSPDALLRHSGLVSSASK